MWTQIKSGMEAPSKVIEKAIRAICRTSECVCMCTHLADVMVCVTSPSAHENLKTAFLQKLTHLVRRRRYLA